MSEPGCSLQCLVCSVPITSTHFGMDTCRACSTFFKRTKTTGRIYPCKGGNRRCSTDKDAHLTCRRCRFDKCIALGMEYNGPLRARRKSTIPILQRIKTESKAFIERRREQELKIIQIHGGHKRYSHPSMEIYDVQQETCYEIYRIFIVESYAFFNNSFPAFSVLKDRERELIFKDYIGKMSMVEGYMRTQQIWGGTKKYMMCSVLTCYDVERAILMDEMQNIDNIKFLLSFTKTYADGQNEIFLPIFTKCSLTEREYYALMALVMSELDSECDISEEAEVILDRYRQETLEDLQLYYQKELGLKDFSTRLGNLMSLNHAIQECKSAFKIFFRFYATIFDVFVTDNLIKDFFL
ncbi:hypothetical protein PENTCL1PPCAC_17106 [Pristionchus entomophagus]|uniref:Nuclear receptor n=1 Tax=Pristionchus entomophagus TaxID=358040 RepID=A0AAV5TKU1_9BILA|nr:hypothetical protein PENTCL1PPCAC_17106 [Pristionchus entomophagus]